MAWHLQGKGSEAWMAQLWLRFVGNVKRFSNNVSFLQHPLDCTIEGGMAELTRLAKAREPLGAPRSYLLSSAFFLMPCPCWRPRPCLVVSGMAAAVTGWGRLTMVQMSLLEQRYRYPSCPPHICSFSPASNSSFNPILPSSHRAWSSTTAARQRFMCTSPLAWLTTIAS